MAWNIHWQVFFVSIDRGQYSVNIYEDGYSGSPITLTGGDSPMVTQEDDDDNVFLPVRLQSGYLRIVLTENTNTILSQLLPTDNLSRFITLTKTGSILWQGYLQNQNFGWQMHTSPLEVDIPVQCVLSSMQDTYLSRTPVTGLQNIAYYIINCFHSIHNEIFTYYFQGGEEVLTWLSYKINQQVFLQTDDEGYIISKYNCHDIISHLCEFFGWVCRIDGASVFFTLPDLEQRFTVLSDQDLYGIANNIPYSYDTMDYGQLSLGNNFMSEDNTYSLVSDISNVSVVAKPDILTDVAGFIDNFVEYTKWELDTLPRETYGNIDVIYSENVYAYTWGNMVLWSDMLSSFNYCRITNADTDQEDEFPVVRIKSSFENGATTPYIRMSTAYGMNFYAPATGYIVISGEIYQKGKRLTDEDTSIGRGNKHIFVSLGIGNSDGVMYWYDGGNQWSTIEKRFRMCVGQSGKDFQLDTHGAYTKIPLLAPVAGKIYLEIWGSNDISEIDGIRKFDIRDLSIRIEKGEQTWIRNGYNVRYREDYKYNSYQYIRPYKVKEISPIIVSWNHFSFSTNILMDASGHFLSNILIDSDADPQVYERPERRLCSRISTFWASSRKTMQVEMKNEDYETINPAMIIKDNQDKYVSLSISRDWRNNLLQLKIIKL